MRRHRWLTIVLSTLVLGCVLSQVHAQEAMPPGVGSPGAPSYGLDTSIFHGGQAPMYYQPWPGVSPYMGQGQQLSNQDGLWHYEDLSDVNGKRRYRFRSEWVRSRTSRGSNLIGNPTAATYKEQIIETLREAGGGGGGGGGDLEDYADALDGTSGFGSFNLYDPVHAENLDKPILNGVRLTLDIDNPDGTGFAVWGLWANDDQTEFNARDDVHVSRGTDPAAALFFIDFVNSQFGVNPAQDPPNTPDAGEVLANQLLNLRGIPLDDGSFVQIGQTTAGGANAIFDLDFRIASHVEMYGTGVRWRGFKFTELGNFAVRPTAGVRFDLIRDHFQFLGRDSGVLYDGEDGTDPPLPDVKIHSIPNGVDDDGDGIIDNAGFIEDSLGGQGGGGQGGQGTTVAYNIIGDPEIFPVTSVLQNEVHSYLAGPEVGISYEVGGNKAFRVGGSTVFGLLVNHQRIALDGDNIFVTTREGDLLPKTPENARPNQFSSKANHNSVSPMLEQQIYIEGPFFNYVPVLRRSPILRAANFRAGYTLTVIGELSRASDSIIWQGNPSQDLFPQIKTDRSTWRSDSLNLGVSWAW